MNQLCSQALQAGSTQQLDPAGRAWPMHCWLKESMGGITQQQGFAEQAGPMHCWLRESNMSQLQ